MDSIGLEEFYFNPEPEIIGGQLIPPITKSHSYENEYPSVVERFFTKYFYCRNDLIDEAHTVLYHSNRICLIGLDKSHVAVKKGIKLINFDIAGNDRSKNEVKGKSKKGGMMLQPTSCIAKVICMDGTEYKVISSIAGKLIEVNERLVSDPTFIGKDGDGFIAIVLPKMTKCSNIISGLLTEDQFIEKIQQNAENIEKQQES